MSIKRIIKSNKAMAKCYQLAYNLFFSSLTVISPKLNTSARYYSVYKKRLNWKDPQTFSEKLLWLKINRYINDPLVIQCADKYRVREYIREYGCGDLLNDLYGVYDSADQIPWDDLPNQFVLKWNFGAGMNFVCEDKASKDFATVKKNFDDWGKRKCWLPYSEMQYKKTPKKIICEKFLKDENTSGAIPDYKVYCFHGEPLAILVMHDRGNKVKAEFFDQSWNKLATSNKYSSPKIPTECPICLEKMLETSKKISAPFPFVRCDYYVVNGQLYFGEMTFTPAGGLGPSQTSIDGKEMSEYLFIPEKGKKEKKIKGADRGGVK